jgi:hypothetical protein
MKSMLLLLAFTLITLANVVGQTLANNSNTASQFHPSNTAMNDTKFHFCQESKVGFGITGAGILLGSAGIAEYNTNSHNNNDYRKNRLANTGAAMWLVGGVVAIMGSVLAIDGSAHDMRRFYHEHKFSISSGSGNEIGVVCNF